MKTSTKKNLVLELDETEIKFLRDLTQKYLGDPGDETDAEHKIRLDFFVVASRALGYDMNEDGSVPRSSDRMLLV